MMGRGKDGPFGQFPVHRADLEAVGGWVAGSAADEESRIEPCTKRPSAKAGLIRSRRVIVRIEVAIVARDGQRIRLTEAFPGSCRLRGLEVTSMAPCSITM
jgi:hypothetical protein